MDWLRNLSKPVKYGIVAAGIGVSSAIVYHYYLNKPEDTPAMEGKLEQVPKIVIDDDDVNESATSSSSDILLPNSTLSDLLLERKKGPVEDESDIGDFEEQKPTRKVLLLGLEGCGKSSLLSQLSREGTNCIEYEPTKGFNVVCISFDNVDLSIWEIGGGIEYRTYWQNFCTTTDVIFFVIDSTDRSKFRQAKDFFYSVFNELTDEIGFYVAATKTDQTNSASVEELREALGLEGTSMDILKVSVQAGGALENEGVDKVQEYCLYY